MTGASIDSRSLDAARGLSAFIVLLAHVIQVFWLRIYGISSAAYYVYFYASHYAVVTFFLLSGFLITQSIELNISRNGRFRTAEYFCARIARIYPPLLVALAVTIVVFGVFELFGLPGTSSLLSAPGDLYTARET